MYAKSFANNASKAATRALERLRNLTRRAGTRVSGAAGATRTAMRQAGEAAVRAGQAAIKAAEKLGPANAPSRTVITLNYKGVETLLRTYESLHKNAGNSASKLALKKLLKRARVSKESQFYKDFLADILAGGNSPNRSGSPAEESPNTKRARVGTEKGLKHFITLYDDMMKESKSSEKAELSEAFRHRLAAFDSMSRFELTRKITAKLLSV
jgi:hypothetical protein